MNVGAELAEHTSRRDQAHQRRRQRCIQLGRDLWLGCGSPVWRQGCCFCLSKPQCMEGEDEEYRERHALAYT